MADTKIRVRKATDLLKEDHQIVKKLFSQAERLDAPRSMEKSKLFEAIKEELTVHAQIEEEIFYPAIERAEKDDADELVKEAHEDHKIVKTLLAELSGLKPEDDTFDAKMKVLKENVLHHAQEEQNDIFPIFKTLDKAEQDRVSELLYARKRELQEDA